MAKLHDILARGEIAVRPYPYKKGDLAYALPGGGHFSDGAPFVLVLERTNNHGMRRHLWTSPCENGWISVAELPTA